MCIGDVFAQLAVDRKVDWKRTLRFTGAGLLCFGPMIHTGKSLSEAKLYNQVRSLSLFRWRTFTLLNI